MTEISRRHDWPEAVAAFIESRRKAAFSYGSNDCALFAADAWRVMTGIDFAADMRDQYSTEQGAFRLVKKLGGMREIVLRTGLIEKARGFSQRYDAVLVPTGDWETLGINAGNGCWCAPGPDGLVFRPICEIESAFGL